MRYVAVGQEIEIEIGHSIDLGLLLMSKVTVGHEDESETDAAVSNQLQLVAY